MSPVHADMGALSFLCSGALNDFLTGIACALSPPSGTSYYYCCNVVVTIIQCCQRITSRARGIFKNTIFEYTVAYCLSFMCNTIDKA